ncbi:hypothetical protein [Clostridium estertheticum]|uniref:Uncharacterized protein n=1 Tax=Clostridium estertheticum TaxID=238834 RepID=A0AA47EIN9_9CLOT|nr:hypothetical protein [Clostridium estertheticum]MBU3153499.1 hypothetical protein [Clostridium estertheticum]WAG60901.1 hypothetical protein LL038_01215 [Clostridium estertheticum]
MPVGLLEDVKIYLHITWEDTNTDVNLTGMINRGIARLQKIAGATLDFTKEDLPKSLLLDYVRYGNSQALEMFEKNFACELMTLHLNTQVDLEIDVVII